MGFYIGLMSGTSMDGIDAALVEIDTSTVRVVDFLTIGYQQDLRRKLTAAIEPNFTSTLHDYATLDHEVGRAFASATLSLLEHANESASDIIAIGSHGQTLRHSPDSNPAYSIQIGHPAEIAARTQINTVADFRSLDIAMGGQGAPLVPAFHEFCFRSEKEDRVVLNIGGIANITILPKKKDNPLVGFDTGPGNCLMDEWISNTLNKTFDEGGAWARGGSYNEDLLNRLFSDSYFSSPPPKSTGREYFNLNYLSRIIGELDNIKISPKDVQATLAELTARSICKSISDLGMAEANLIICGGGARNEFLMELIASQHGGPCASSDSFGIDVESVEAACFAWLACNAINGKKTRITTNKELDKIVTGAVYRA